MSNGRRTSALSMPDVPMGKLPDHLEVQRTRVVCKADAPINTEGIQYSGAYAAMGVDNSKPLDMFQRDFKIDVIRLTEDEMEFDMIGIDAAIANAFRRILISEVPTMTIDKVFMVDNTSPIVDEVLAHRLGLIPLDADPRLFEYMSEHDVPNERNTIVYRLNVSCEKGSPRLTVKSDQLEWLPDGSKLHEVAPSYPGEQQKTYTSFSGSQLEVSKRALGVKHKDITIARLGPGQTIELEAHAVKGIGKMHAKWSPVATAWYRMLPEVILLKEIKGEEAKKLVKKCPVKVFDIEDLGNGEERAVVKSPRACTLCRECLRGESEEQIELRRVRDHFIFTIESASALPPEVLFKEAVEVLQEKCSRVISELS
ncbi:RNA polymerase I subunit 43 [Carex rostrata]